MTDLKFRPIFPKHAIERCAVTYGFRSVLPEKLFTALKGRHAAAVESAGFTQQPGTGLNIDLVTGRVSSAAGSMPMIFNSVDGASAFVIAPNALTFQTTRYVRWSQFQAGLEQVVVPVLNEFLTAVGGATIRLEYSDCFIWDGSWDNFDSGKLLSSESDLVIGASRKFKGEWHSNSGWFEDMGMDRRRLLNVNVAAVQRQRQDGSMHPALTILTLGMDQTNQGVAGDLFDSSEHANHFLEKLHGDLKVLLSRVISTHMANTIGLNLP